MGRLIKWLFYLLVIAGLAFVAYAYVGEYLGDDFGPPQSEIRMPVQLDE